MHNSYRPFTFVQQPDEPTPIFLGFELELVARDALDVYEGSGATLTRDGRSLIQTRDDGSLVLLGRYEDDDHDDVGIELVSDPFSARYYRETLREPLTRWLQALNATDLHANGTCGLHIHVARAAFTTEDHLLRYCRTFLVNVGWTQDWSGRDWDWSRGYDEPHAQCYARLETAQTVEEVREQIQWRRAMALRSSTVEMRFPGATLNPDTFHRHLETVLATIEATRTCAWDDATPLTLLDHVRSHADQYPAIAAHLGVCSS
jgi:hypothetical protein